MNRRLLILGVIVLAAVVIGSVSFRFGARAQRTEENRTLAYAQAVLAFGHHRSYERIESFLAHKCYEAAMTEATELKKLQLSLLSKNLRASDNDPGLVEYIKLRDPKLLETVEAGQVPQPRIYTTTCP